MTLIEVIIEYAIKLRIEGCDVADAWLDEVGVDPVLHSHIQGSVNDEGDLIDADGEIIKVIG